MKYPLLCAAMVGLLAAQLQAAERTVGDVKELKRAIKEAVAGDVILLKDGEWKDATDIKFYGQGTAEKPITLRAQTPGKVILTGNSSLRIGGSYLIVDDLRFESGGVPEGHVIQFRGESDKGAENCRLTNTAIIDYNAPGKPTAGAYYVSLYGKKNRVDHCYFAGKTTLGPTFVVWVEDEPNEHHIDHNYFAGRPPLGVDEQGKALNGGETMRIGTSQVSMNISRTLVENNYYENCDGEAEIISNKSCENVYRGNTFVSSRGALTLRHGNRCRVEGNFFFGHDKPGTGGVRLIGEDHVVINNYLDGLAGEGFESAMPFVNGIPDSKPNEYFRVKRALVAHNTIVNCAQPMTFGVGKGARNRIEPPQDCTIANNLIVGTKGPLIQFLDQPTGTKWIGNIVFGAEAGLSGEEGVRVVDPKLVKDESGMYRPAADSPVRGAAVGSANGTNAASTDVGCDQASSAATRPTALMAEDVGPEGWKPQARH